MKEIRTIKMVEVTDIKFIADDGKEFVGENAEFECKKYERQQNEHNVTKEFEKLNAKMIDLPFVYSFIDEGKIWEVTLNSKKDYYAMEDYFNVIEGCYNNYVPTPNEYPCTITVLKHWDCIDEYKGNIKDELQKALEQLD